MSGLANGSFYYFLRPSGAAYMGHMGWGFQRAEHQWCFGALENPDSSLVVVGGNNGYWLAQATTEAEMREQMRTMEVARTMLDRDDLPGYSLYKRIPVTNAKPEDAWNLAGGQRGYVVFFNNCLDNAARVGDAYGAPVWSWSRHGLGGVGNMLPNVYFFETLWQYGHEWL